MLQKLAVDGFELVGKISQFNEDSIKKTIMKIVIQDIFLNFKLNILSYYKLHNDFPLLQQRIKVNKCEKLTCNLKFKNVVHIRMFYI